MDESTTRETFTDTKALERDLRLFRDVTESRLGAVSERFDRVDQMLGQHGLALTELAMDLARLQTTLSDHGRERGRSEP